MKATLNIEIKQTYYKLQNLQTNWAAVAGDIRRSDIPTVVADSFFEGQRKFGEKNLRKRTAQTKRKFNNIITRKTEATVSSDLPTNNAKAIHNGTTVAVPPEAEVLLSLGLKFALPIIETQHALFYHLLADVEQVINTNPDNTTQDRTRCAIANVVTY